MYYEQLLVALIPIAVTVAIYWIQKKGYLNSIKPIIRRIILGLVFGVLACAFSVYGGEIEGELVSLSDAVILSGGLIFGGSTGIIAGIVTGLFRGIVAVDNLSDYTRIVSILACVVAGLYAGFARRFMFENKTPSWIMGLFIGATMEVFRLNLLFGSKVSDFKATLQILNKIAVVTVVVNGLVVAISILFITLIAGGQIFYDRHKKAKISQTVQAWLLGTVFIALVFSSFFTFSLQSFIANIDATSVIANNIDDVSHDIKDASDDNLLKLATKIEEEVKGLDNCNNDVLRTLLLKYNVDEISVIDEDGFIRYSTNESFIGYDMNSGDQSSAFMCLIDGSARKYVQDLMPISYDKTNMKYAGVRCFAGGFVQVGYNEQRFYSDIQERVELAAVNRHIGQNGYIVITNNDFEYQSFGKESDMQYMSDESGPSVLGEMLDGVEEYSLIKGVIRNREVFCMYTNTEGYNIIGVLPTDDAYFSRNIALYANTFTEILIFSVLFAVIYILIRVIVVNNIFKINQSLAQITGGNLDTIVDVRNNEEFSLLSNDINSTVDTLKRYIAEAASRIDAELQYAKDIQHSALPQIAPNYVGRKHYELHACMFTAKEVGGDFYDFYYVDDDHLAFTIADVSGKGIPAALFMMTAKTMLRNIVESGMEVEEAMTHANERLCENNEANMFVTVWAAVIDLRNGHMVFGNAGHNYPAIRKAGGGFEFLVSKPNMVLAGMEGVNYRRNEYDLSDGDVLFLYTDGVTEATNAGDELFGDDRLIASLDKEYREDITMEELCLSVKADVDEFVDEAPQFDDMTMVAFKYKA